MEEQEREGGGRRKTERGEKKSEEAEHGGGRESRRNGRKKQRTERTTGVEWSWSRASTVAGVEAVENPLAVRVGKKRHGDRCCGLAGSLLAGVFSFPFFLRVRGAAGGGGALAPKAAAPFLDPACGQDPCLRQVPGPHRRRHRGPHDSAWARPRRPHRHPVRVGRAERVPVR